MMMTRRQFNATAIASSVGRQACPASGETCEAAVQRIRTPVRPELAEGLR
jgi:hypothetical protein